MLDPFKDEFEYKAFVEGKGTEQAIEEMSYDGGDGGCVAGSCCLSSVMLGAVVGLAVGVAARSLLRRR